MAQYQMKLSELTYEFLESIGLTKAHMRTDHSDSLRCIYNAPQTEDAKKELAEKYGDVNLIIDPDAVWSQQIRIDDAKWQEDFDAYCEAKAEWYRKWGCD